MTVAYANSPVLGVASAPNDTACVIQQILPNSAAEKAGLFKLVMLSLRSTGKRFAIFRIWLRQFAGINLVIRFLFQSKGLAL